MSAIPQEWIDTGARALGTDAGCTADFDTLQRLYGWEAEAVLTAVLPLIRESIARDIEAQCEADEPPCLGCWEAARTARGGAL